MHFRKLKVFSVNVPTFLRDLLQDVKMVGGLTSDLFIQLTTTLAHLSNITNNQARGFGGEVSNETLQGKMTFMHIACYLFENTQNFKEYY